MPERNYTFVWGILLLVLVVGIILIPIPEGYTGRVLLFSDTFDSSTIDTAKWNIAKSTEVDLSISSQNNLEVNTSTSLPTSAKISSKGLFEGDIFEFSARMKVKSESGESSIDMLFGSWDSTFGWSNYVYFAMTSNGVFVEYLDENLKYITESNLGIDLDDKWVNVIIIMDKNQKGVSFDVTENSNIIIQSAYNDLYVSERQSYFVFEFKFFNQNDISHLDDVYLYTERAVSPYIDIWWLIIVAIISLALVLIGSAIFGNCQHIHAIMTMLGLTGLLIVAGLLLNVWWIVTWSFITAIIGFYCFIVLIVYENWNIDWKYYDTAYQVAIVIGIVCFIISIIEYLYLTVTNAYTPFWASIISYR